MPKFSVLILFGFIFLFFACDENKLYSRKNFESLYWLEGQWKGNLNKGIYYENWIKENPDLLAGRSFFIEGRDTIMSEKAWIEKGFTGIYYSVQVGDQNEVDFLLVEKTESMYIFENALHEFPQRIIYIKKDNDNLLARIEGLKDGKRVYEEFRLQRQK